MQCGQNGLIPLNQLSMIHRPSPIPAAISDWREGACSTGKQRQQLKEGKGASCAKCLKTVSTEAPLVHITSRDELCTVQIPTCCALGKATILRQQARARAAVWAEQAGKRAKNAAGGTAGRSAV